MGCGEAARDGSSAEYVLDPLRPRPLPEVQGFVRIIREYPSAAETGGMPSSLQSRTGPDRGDRDLRKMQTEEEEQGENKGTDFPRSGGEQTARHTTTQKISNCLFQSEKVRREAFMLDRMPLKIESLCKDFRRGGGEGSVRVLDHVSLEACEGDFVAVMGPSGSGKSTLLHVAGGLTDASEGKVFVEGRDLSGLSDGQLSVLRRRRIGFVFQSFNLISTLTVEDNICLPILADGGHPDRAALHSLAERLGIADKLTRFPVNLSGGEQQRVAIARALLPKPAIILADEPTGSLDTISGQEFCSLLDLLCREENATIILVTHEPAVAAWAKRTLVLKDGRLIGTLPPETVKNAHLLASAYQDILSQEGSGGVK